MTLYYTYSVMKILSKTACCRILYNSYKRNAYDFKPILFFDRVQNWGLVSCPMIILNKRQFSCQSVHSYNLGKEDDTAAHSIKTLPQAVIEKIKYNCILSEPDMKLSWKQKKILAMKNLKKERERRENLPDIPLALKYIGENILSVTKEDEEEQEESYASPFDYKPYMISCSAFKKEESYTFHSDRKIDSYSNFSDRVEKTKDWLKNYEFYDDNNDKMTKSPLSRLNYGTPDKSVPISKVPCGGCGAYLQCQDTGIPGYLPSELLKQCTLAELRALKCQRCHFLEQYNMALNLNVPPDEYPKLLAHIKEKFALAVLMVDLVDFPCSLWPGIMDIIGVKRPVIVVGNKVDLLPRDSPQFLSYAQSWLEEAVKKSELGNANIKAVSLVSAQTGYGVEELITQIHKQWGYQGDVYLLGCTNVGKSTLFNALLRSDLCKSRAVDIMQRATTSPWPGTTLNLLKFPIMRPDGWRLYQRVLRLRQLQFQRNEDLKLLRQQLKKSRNPLQATLIGHIGRTIEDPTSMSNAADPFSLKPSASEEMNLHGLNPNRKDFVLGKWCYDTPGTVHPDQVLDILTAQELVHLLPREMLLPRTFSLFTGDSLLIGGLGRLDFERGAEKTRFTVFAASTLPITVCLTRDVNLLYNDLATSNLLVVPGPKSERLSHWPGLSPFPQPIEISGINSGESAADIVLSSAGWIAVTPREGDKCVVRVWTPFAKGIHVRQPALLRFSVNLRGKKVRKSPAYLVGRAVKV